MDAGTRHALSLEALRMPGELYAACERGDNEMVTSLIAEGADVNEESETDGCIQSSLMIALRNGHIEVMKVLIEAKANVDHLNKSSLTPRVISTGKDDFLEVPRALMEAESNVGGPEDYGCTPLYFAAKTGHVEVTRVLIEAQADVDRPDKYDRTPLYIAAEKGHLEVARMLIEAQANVDQPEKAGWTPLYNAVANNKLECARLLLDNRANPHLATTKAFGDHLAGATPLRRAIKDNKEDFVALLRSAGARK